MLLPAQDWLVLVPVNKSSKIKMACALKPAGHVSIESELGNLLTNGTCAYARQQRTSANFSINRIKARSWRAYLPCPYFSFSL